TWRSPRRHCTSASATGRGWTASRLPGLAGTSRRSTPRPSTGCTRWSRGHDMRALEARDVRKVYWAGSAREVHALDGVSVMVGAGRFAALTGPSGSGKTTLLAMLGALD